MRAVCISTLALTAAGASGHGARPPGSTPPAGDLTPQATDSLLNYFKSSCPASYDSWTARALADTDALVSLLQKAKDDPNCGSLSGSLGRLQLLSTQLNDYQNRDNTNNEQFLGLKRKKQELLLQLSDTQTQGDTALEAIVREELRSLQLDQGELQGHMEADRDYNDKLKFGKALYNFVIATDTVLDQASKSGACLQKNHDLLPAIAGVASAAASAYLPTSYAFLASAGVELISSVVEYVRVNKLDRQMAAVDVTKLEVAMQCGLESMSDQWCASDEGSRLADLTQKFLINRPNPQGKLWQAITVYQRDIPVLKKFLDNVQAGAMPTNTAANDRREEVLAKVAFVRDFETFAIALISQNQNLFEKAGATGTPTERVANQWIIERDVINEIWLQSQAYERSPNGIPDAGNPNSPFSKVMQGKYIKFFLAGHMLDDIPRCGPTGGGRCTGPNDFAILFDDLDPTKPTNNSYWPTSSTKVSLADIKNRVHSLVDLARNLVLQERSELVNVDPLSITYSFHDRDTRFQNLTPESALRDIESFVQARVAAHPGGRDFLDEDTAALLQVIDAEMAKVFTADNRDDAKGISAFAIEDITAQLKLAEGYDFFQRRLETATENALLDLVVDGSNDPNSNGDIDQVSRFLATEDILSQLNNEAGAPSLPELKLRLDHSKTVSQTTLRNFSALFSTSIRKVVEYLWQNGQRDAASNRKNYWETPYGQQHAQLCFRLLSVDQLPRDLKLKDTRCEGAKMVSGYEGLRGAPASLVFTGSMLDGAYDGRACTLRNYDRKVRIFESRIQPAQAHGHEI